MPHLKLHYRFRFLALIAFLCVAVAGQLTSFAQDSPDYIQFLEQQSMLFQADQQADKISGEGVQWRNTYGMPEPTELVKTASVWLLYYPGSVITKPNSSVLGTWADPQFWDTMKDIGIEALHTNPIERGGGIKGTEFTPTIDGWFDRISLDIDPQFGTEDEFRQMVQNAGQRGAIIAGDLVPLHTGLGPDFRLAQRAFKDYPGMYTMVEIPQELWTLLPKVDDPWGSALVPREAAAELKNRGFIPGIINSADADPSSDTWSGWSATPEVVGVDGKTRRWVFLHVFKPGQPVLNWLDPSYASRRALYGDTARNIVDRGAKVMRLDAVPFTGIEPDPNDPMAQTYLHPLSITASEDLAFMARKLGGWTFQELYVPLEQLKLYTQYGPDLSYDFFTRAQVLHPLITGDVTPLRLAHSVLLQQGVQAATLIHDLQNHDEITYQLIDLGSRSDIQFDGQHVNGMQLKEQILNQMRSTVGAAPFNKLYRPEQDGVATTFAGFAAAALKIDPYHASPDQVELIKRAHLLFAHANAMQPGVFALSAWDLVGALPIPPDTVADKTVGGDWRWINRGGVDLMNVNAGATTSVFGLPKAQALYGSLPEQLANPDSFASRLKKMLAARKQFRIPEATMNAVPPTGNPAVAVLAMTLPDQKLAITALNYGPDPASVEVDLTLVPPGIPATQVANQTAQDIVANQRAGTVGADGKLKVDVDGLSGKTLVVPRQGVMAAATSPPTPGVVPPPAAGSQSAPTAVVSGAKN